MPLEAPHREVAEARGYNEIRITREGTARIEVTIQGIVQSGNVWQPEGDPVAFSVV